MKSYIGYAIKSLEYRWKRTLFMLIGAILMVMLLCSAVIIVETRENEEFESTKRMVGNYHIRIDNLNDEQLGIISAHLSTLKLGRVNTVGFSYINKNLKLNILNYDDNAAQMLYLTLKEGHMPQNSTEIAVEDWVLSTLGMKSVLGQNITINIINQDVNHYIESIDHNEGNHLGTENESYTKTFKLSGILYNNRNNYNTNTDTDTDTAPVFVHMDSNETIESLSAIVQVKKNTNVSEYDHFLISTLQIQQSNVHKNHLMLQQSGMEDNHIPGINSFMLLIIVISAALLFVISNMFSLSMRERIKEIGILKALGGSFNKIVFYLISEAFVIGIIAIPLGTLLGILQSWVILQFSNSSDFNISFQIPWLKVSVVLILSFSSLIISIFVTAFTASRLPTLSAINGVLVKKPQKNASKLVNNIKRMGPAFKLALVNMYTSKTRFIINCCALGLLLSIFYAACYTSHENQLNKIVRFKGDFSITLRDSTLNQTEIENLSTVDGVDYVFCPVQYARGFVEFPPNQVSESYLNWMKEYDTISKNNQYSDLQTSDDMRKALTNPATNSFEIHAEIYGADDNELTLLKSYLTSGGIDVSKMKNEKLIIIKQNIHRVDNVIQMSDFKVSDGVTFSYRDERKPEQSVLEWFNDVTDSNFKVCGILDFFPYSSREGDITIIGHKDVLSSIFQVNTYEVKDFSIVINANADRAAVKEKLLEFIKKDSNPFIYDAEKEAEEKAREETLILIMNFLYILIIFIVVLSIVNTLKMNLLARSREIGIQRAIGMDTFQLVRSVLAEGFIYGLVSSFIGLIFSAGIIAVFYFQQPLRERISPFLMPGWQIAAGFCGILILCMVATLPSLKSIVKARIIKLIYE